MAFGEILRNARTQRGMSTLEVAEQTRILVQVVEDLEREDFQRIAAPIYGRGFVKSYAKLMELEPQALIDDFMQLYSGARPPVILTPPEESVAEEAAAVAPPKRVGKERVVGSEAVATVSAAAAVGVEAGGDVAPPKVVPAVPREEDAAAAVPAAKKEVVRRTPLRKDFRPTLVVAPEEDEVVVPREPDLFSQAARGESPPERPSAVVEGGDALNERRKMAAHNLQAAKQQQSETAAKEQRVTFRATLRKRMSYLGERISGFFIGMRAALPVLFQGKQTLLVGAAGVIVLALMITGITLLFKATGKEGRASAVVEIKQVAPPPALYID